MEEIVKLLNENLEYVKHEVLGDRIKICVKLAVRNDLYWSRSFIKLYMF
jgi:uncharacterized protein (DUF1810 family)